MKTLVYHGPGERAWEPAPDPSIIDPTDAIVRVDTSTICLTDLHILNGDVPAVRPTAIPTLHLETLWIRDVMTTAALVNANTTTKLLRLIEGGRLEPTPFATHHLPLADTEAAYDLFAAAAETHALKVVLQAVPAETRTLVAAGGTTHQQRSTRP